MIRKQSTDPIFDQVSVTLWDDAHRNMNQKYVFFKKTLISDGLSMLTYRTLPLLSRISLVKFLKIIAPKKRQIPQKISFIELY